MIEIEIVLQIIDDQSKGGAGQWAQAGLGSEEREQEEVRPSEATIMLSISFCLFEGYQTRGRRC